MSKKIVSVVFTVFIFCFSLILFAGAEDTTGAYLVESPHGVKLYANAEETLEFKTVSRQGAYLNIIKIENGFGYTVYDSIFGWVKMSDGLSFVSKMPSITDGEKLPGAKALEITSMPKKTVFVEGEDSADIDGLIVSVIFDDGFDTRMEVSGYAVSFPTLDTYGKKTVDIYYSGLSASYDIEVVKVPVTDIVLTLPVKTAFVEGEAISLDGLVVTAFYSDGRDNGSGLVLSDDEYIISGITEGQKDLKPGTYEVSVMYKYPEMTKIFRIYVLERGVTSLRLTKLPPNPTLYQGLTFNKADFELIATFDNGETIKVKDFDIECDNMTLGTHTARIYYMGKYVAFDYVVIEHYPVGIETGPTESVGSYVDTDINFDKLTVYLVYNSGEKRLLESGYDLEHSIDTKTAGQYKVKVTYGEFTCEFDYTVAPRNQVVLGDVNGDGLVTAADARLALRAAVKLEILDATQFIAADVNYDNKVTGTDARKILRYSLKLDEKLYE